MKLATKMAVICQMSRRLLTTYSVPIAAALLGWMFGEQVAVWFTGRIAPNWQEHFLSPPLVHSTKLIASISLFLFTNRCFN